MSTATASRVYKNDTVIDATAQGATTIETTVTDAGADRRFHCAIVDPVIVNKEYMLAGPVISIGTNDPDYNDLMTAQQVGILAGLALSTSRPEVPEGTAIKCKVVTPATAVPFHSVVCDLRVVLIGVDNVY